MSELMQEAIAQLQEGQQVELTALQIEEIILRRIPILVVATIASTDLIQIQTEATQDLAVLHLLDQDLLARLIALQEVALELVVEADLAEAALLA